MKHYNWDIFHIPQKAIPRLRQLVQATYLIFCLWTGWRFFLFFKWATGQSSQFIPRPPAVEAFLPISALVGLKQFVLTGRYDAIHPAGLTVFMAAVATSFLWRKGFCGWICPVGTISNLIEKAGRKIGVTIRLPAWIDLPLLGLKYLLLGFFLYFVLWKMDMSSIEAFIRSPYNMAADAKMLQFFLSPSETVLGTIAGLMLVSLFIKNFWCRYLCPYGALLGILAILGPTQIRRDTDLCTGCKRCENACPSSIRIMKKSTIRTAECIGCMECVSTCPVNGCLEPSTSFWKRTPLLVIPLGTICTLLIFWLTAKGTGHWNTTISPYLFKKIYQIQQIMH